MVKSTNMDPQVFEKNMDPQVFENWMKSADEAELMIGLLEIQNEDSRLFTPGELESYYRDRYERHDTLVMREVKIKRLLAERWYHGLIEPVRPF